MEREASKEVGRMLAVRARPPVALRLALELFKILPADSRDPQAFSVTRTGPNMGPDKIINTHMEFVRWIKARAFLMQTRFLTN